MIIFYLFHILQLFLFIQFPTNGNSANNNHQTSEEYQQHRRKAVARKLSMGHQRRSAEDPRTELYMQALSPRRLSFPERTLYSAVSFINLFLGIKTSK
jgi:hypothetical protein